MVDPGADLLAGNRDDEDAVLRIVYYGPGLSGKTTNLEALAKHLDDGSSRLMRFPSNNEHDGACEFLACDAMELGWPQHVRLHCYAGPGAYLKQHARQQLLQDVSGIVFVADARRWRLDANMVLLDELGSRLAAIGRVPPMVGLVLQYNRMDDPEALPLSRLDLELNRHEGPSLPAVAIDGVGVVETLHALITAIRSHH